MRDQEEEKSRERESRERMIFGGRGWGEVGVGGGEGVHI